MVSIGPRISIQGETEYRASLMRIISATKELDSEMDLMVAKFSKSDSALEKNRQMHDKLTEQIKQHEAQLEKMRGGLDLANQKHQKNQEALAKATAEYEKAKKEYGEGSKELEAYEKAVEKARTAVERSGKNIEDWKTRINEAEIEVEDLKRKLENLPSSLEIVGKGMEEFGEGFSSFGESLTKYVTTPLVALGTASIKASSDFTDGMAKIYTIAQEGQKPMAEMRAELEQLSASTGFAISDLTEASYQAVSASVKTEDAVGFVSDAAKLARAGFTSTTQAVDLLTTAINAYGYEAKDATYISDVLLKTQNDGKTIINELAGVMGTVIPTAAASNVSLENLAAAYVVTTKQGVNTARATTFLNSMFTELERGTSTVSKTLKEKTGKSFAQLMGEGKSLGDVLGILYKSVKNDDEAFAQLWGNVRAGRGGLALVNMGVDYFNEALQRVNNSAGQTQYALDVLETPSLKAKRAINQLSISAGQLGDALIEDLYPMFIKGVDKINEWTQSIIGTDDATMKAVGTFLVATAAIGPLIVGAGKIISLLGKAVTWISKVAAGTASLSSVIGVSVVALWEMGAAAAAMQQKRLDLIDAEYGMTDAMKDSKKAVDNLKKSHEDFEKTMADAETANRNQILTVEELVRQYNALVGENGKVSKENQNLADVILNQLAEAMGVEIDDVKKLIEKNGKFGESIEKNIEQIKKRAEMEVYEERYKEAIKRKTEAQEEYTKAEALLAEQHKKTAKAQEEYDKALKEYNDHLSDGTAKTGGYEDALEKATEALATAKAAESEMTGAVSDTREEIRKAESDMALYGKKMGQGVADAEKGIKNNTDKVVKAAKTLSGKVVAAMEINGENIGYYADKGFADGMDKYSEMVRKAAKRVAAKAVRGMKDTLSIESPSKVMEELGEYTGEGFVIGIENWIGKTEDAAERLAESAMSTGNAMNRYHPYGNSYSNKTVTAPISVSVNVTGNVGNDYGKLADTVADRIAKAIQRKEEVFA